MAVGRGADAALAPDLDALLPPQVVSQLVTLPHELVDAALRCAALEMRLTTRETPTTTADERAGLERLATTHGLGKSALSAVYAALSGVLARAAHDNAVTGASLPDVFDEFGIHDEGFIDVLTELLPRYLPATQNVLRQSSFDFAHVVDVSWRLDYVLRSSVEGSVREPRYLVELTLQPPQGALERTQFCCSMDEMRDLVYRLQDATNAIEKLVHGSERQPSLA
ncbi:hypothetical protein PINS_up005863 [Pythium insidiosum]|nr:hypothetical protein PINS_up005863 [Pythium insidiosum]